MIGFFMLTMTISSANSIGYESRETGVLLTIPEDSPIGTKIGDIVTDSGLRRIVPSHQLQGMEFRFTTDPPIPLSVGPKDGMVWTRGIVDRESLPSCRSKKNCSFTLDLSVQPYEHFRIIKARVEVLDVNDNSPSFSDRSIQLNILESSAINSSYLLPPAMDPDSPMYGVKRYELMEWTADQHPHEYNLQKLSRLTPSRTFGLLTSQKLDGFFEVRLLLREKLDRETKDVHWLQLTAYDGGPVPKSDSMNITILVQDSNDNEPIFEHQTYETSIFENSPRGTEVTRVRATDADLGMNGRIRYDLTSQTRVLYGHVFGINNFTGQIFVVGKLDREVHPAYQLIITAEDEGPDSHPVDVTVTVHLEDENDNEPEITINTLLAATENTDEVPSSFDGVEDVIGVVPENSPSGTFVAQVTVVDPDRGENGTVDCVILDQMEATRDVNGRKLQNHSLLRKFNKRFVGEINATDLNLLRQHPAFRDSKKAELIKCSGPCKHRELADFQNDGPPQPNFTPFRLSRRSSPHHGETEYQVLTGGHLDRESAPQGYKLTVACSDSGRPPKTSVKFMVVLLADENDNDPVFSRAIYTARIQENKVAPNNPILGVSASDADLGLNGQVFFKIDKSGWEPTECKDSFAVDRNDGYIYAVKPVDRESVVEVHFKILAIDFGEPPRTGTADVIILIDDVNDQNPVFSESNYIFKILENQLPGTIVGHVSATDLDLASDNTDIRYSLVQDSTSNFFTIDSRNGSIHTSVLLNRETHPTFYFTVIAEDRGKPPLSGSSNVNVHVEDQNDNSPVFVFPSNLNSTFHMSSNFPPGTPIISISAVDADHDSNAKVTYQLLDCRLYDEVETKRLLNRDLWDAEDSADFASMNFEQIRNSYHNKTIVENNKDSLKSEHSLIQSSAVLNISPTAASTSTTPSNPNTRRSRKCSTFSVDPLQGTLYSKIDLSNLSGRSFRLSFLAEDGGKPSLSSSSNVLLVVNSSVPYSPPEDFRENWENQLFMENHMTTSRHKGRSYYMIFVISIGFACLLVLCGTLTLLVLLIRRSKRRHTAMTFNRDLNGNRSVPPSCFCDKENSFGLKMSKGGNFKKDFVSSAEKMLPRLEQLEASSRTRENTSSTCFTTSDVVSPATCHETPTNSIESTSTSGCNISDQQPTGPWVLLNGSQNPEIRSATTSFPCSTNETCASLKNETKALKGILRPSPRHLSSSALEPPTWNDLVTRQSLDQPYCTIRHNRTVSNVGQPGTAHPTYPPKPPPPYYSKQNPRPVPKRTSSISSKPSTNFSNIPCTFSTVPRRHGHHDNRASRAVEAYLREEQEEQNGVLVTAIL